MIVTIIYSPYVKKSQIAYNGNKVENDSMRKYFSNKKCRIALTVPVKAPKKHASFSY